MLTIGNAKPSKKIKWLKTTVFFISSLISIIAIALIVWTINEIKYQDPIIPQNIISKSVNRTLESFSHLRLPIKRMLGFNSDFPTINLDIKYKNYAVLEKISDNNGNGRRETYVPANIRTDNKSVKAKIRLQGDREIHWADPERWSFRVQVSDDTVFGMRKFSIQHPVTRNYIYEWMFHDFLKREGLIGLNYQFVTLNVNGTNKGVYALEEKSDKILIESNQRRNGPIFKFTFDGGINFDTFWDDIRVSAYQEKAWTSNDPILLAKAEQLLLEFIHGDLTVDEVFDTDKLARFFAITDLFSMFHATIPDGIRLYFNPITQLFEPIGSDGHFLDKAYPMLVSQLSEFTGEQGFWGYGKWYERLFDIEDGENVELYEKYMSELDRLSSPGYIEEYLEDIDREINNILDFIYSDFPFSDLWTMHPLTGVSPFFYYDKNVILNKRSTIKERIKLNSPLYVKDINYDGESLSLNLSNKAKLPIKIINVKFDNKFFDPLLSNYIDGISNNRLNANEPIHFISKTPGSSINKSNELVLKIQYSVIGMSEVYDQTFFYSDNSLAINKEGNLNKFNFIQVDGSNLYLGPGDIELAGDLIVPETYKLIILPGTSIDLTNSSRIISYSPIIIKGIQNKRIEIYSSDVTGQGILVIKAKGDSVIDYVDFRDQIIQNTSQSVSSALTFYESNAIIQNSIFSKNVAEDVINIVRSEFTIDNITIKDSFSDGIDIDFANGSILNSKFYNIGNDSIDLSGSIVELSHINSFSSGDKAVSIGEGSTVYAKGIDISNSRIGFAIKDSSYLELLESTVRDSEIGFTVFQKKQEFQSPKADIWRYTSKNVKQEYLLEEGSSLIFDGLKAKPNSIDLRDELY
jgi:hypothetical protein